VQLQAAVRQIGSFAYHFWMKDMIPLRYRNGNQYLHRKSADYRSRVKRKMRAYHAFIQAGVVAQGLLQYLAVVAPSSFGTRSGPGCEPFVRHPPSELVVANALRQTLPEFLMGPAKTDSLTKFIADRQDTEKCGYSGWLREQKEALLRKSLALINVESSCCSSARNYLGLGFLCARAISAAAGNPYNMRLKRRSTVHLRRG